MTAKRIKKAAILVCAGFMALSLPGSGQHGTGCALQQGNKDSGRNMGTCVPQRRSEDIPFL